MKRALIFGTGASATHLMKNLPGKTQYLAAVDNDAERYGEEFFGLPIIPPSSIQNYEYDEIIIGSYWEGTIKKQLIEELNIDPEKIVTPNKKFFKNDLQNLYPFKDKPTLELAKKVIKTLCGKACSENIPLHVDYGTLLGLVRDEGLIDWDDDIDLAADVLHADVIQAFLLRTVNSIDDRVLWQVRKDLDPAGRTIFFYLKFESKPGYSFKPFGTSIAMKGMEDGKAVKLKSFGAWYSPAHHVESLDTLIWEQIEMFIPSRHEDYLEFTYGDWKTPVQDSSIGTGENWACVSIETVKQSKITSEFILNYDA